MSAPDRPGGAGLLGTVVDQAAGPRLARPAGRPWPAPRPRSPTRPPGGAQLIEGHGSIRQSTVDPPRRRCRDRGRPAGLVVQQRGDLGIGDHGPRRGGQGLDHRLRPASAGSSESILRAAADSRRSPTHSKGLPVVAHERREPGDLFGIGEHVPPDDGGQRVGLEERGQHEPDEPALRTVAAPAVAGTGVLAEHRVAAAERGVVLGGLGRRPGRWPAPSTGAAPSRTRDRGRRAR